MIKMRQTTSEEADFSGMKGAGNIANDAGPHSGLDINQLNLGVKMIGSFEILGDIPLSEKRFVGSERNLLPNGFHG